MCIDTLHIGFNRSRRGGRRRASQNSDYISPPHAHRADLAEIISRLPSHYNVDEEIEEWSGGYKGSFNIYAPDYPDTPAFHLVCSMNDGYLYLDKIEARPMFYSRFEDFWAVLQAMDDVIVSGDSNHHRVIDQGYITRIDYTCDYRVPFIDIMQGLNINRAQTVIGFEDLEHPYAQYEWRRGVLGSFQIGKMPKVIKIYDKLAQTQSQNADLNSAWDDENTSRPCTAQSHEDNSWTRIEIMATRQSYIADKIWNKYHDRGTDRYGGWLRELPSHINDIRTSTNCPFKGILINHAVMRGTDIDKRVPAQKLRHEVDMGFLMNVVQRLGSTQFWGHDRLRAFKLYPWLRSNQPSYIFRHSVLRWTSPNNYSNDFRKRINKPRHHRNHLLTRRWPWEWTHFEDTQQANGTIRRRIRR